MLTIKDLIKTFASSKGEEGGRVRAIDGVTIDVEPGHLFTFLGPSGCGKTTTLRCVAGLERPDSGVIRVGDTTLYSSSERMNVPANQRGLGMVFQSYAIWPHMNVFKNVSFPLEVDSRNQRLTKPEIEQRVERVLEVVQLDHLASRQATDLSGGQQQRLALARALVMEPPLLLLDEPLSNLDAQLREEMRFELKRLQRELGITSIYVTHDQVEALAMSNRIAVMNAGQIEQLGSPREVYQKPTSKFVAGFIGTTNFIDARIARAEAGDLYVVATEQGELQARSQAQLPVGADVIISIRPEHIGLASPSAEARGPNLWRGRVDSRAFLGESVDHVVSVGGQRLQVRCPTNVSIPPGSDVDLRFPVDETAIIPAER